MNVTELVLCVDIFQDHLPGSVLVRCVECQKKLWCSAHHVHEGRKAICIDCIPKKGVEVGIHAKDLLMAIKAIAQREGKCESSE